MNKFSLERKHVFEGPFRRGCVAVRVCLCGAIEDDDGQRYRNLDDFWKGVRMDSRPARPKPEEPVKTSLSSGTPP